MWRRQCAAAGIVITVVLGGMAQTARPEANNPPSFAGRWVIDRPASDLGEVDSGWFGDDVTITQDVRSITFAATGATGSSTYQLDGTPTKRVLRGTTREDSAKWEGSRLVLTTRNTSSDRIDPATNKPSVSERTVTVQIDRGGKLVVDVDVPVPTKGQFAKHSVYQKAK
jgi:hypothetical protein